jgi:flagellar hook-length control protein FliK
LPSEADIAPPLHRFNLQQPVSLAESKPIEIEENLLPTQPRSMPVQVGSIALPEQMPTPTLAEPMDKIAVVLSDDVSVNIPQIDTTKIAAAVPLPLPLAAIRMNSVPATQSESKLQSVPGAALKVTLPVSEIPVIGVNDAVKADQSVLANPLRAEGIAALPLANLTGATGESLASDPASTFPLQRDTAPMLMQHSNVQLLNTVSSPQPVIASVDGPATTATQPGLPVQLQTMSALGSRDSVDWGNGIGERVSYMIDQKSNSATIRLDPPSLGKLDVQIKMSDDVTTITIQTQNAQTRDLIESASQRLRDYLQENGQQTVNVDVSHRQDQQQAMTQDNDKNVQDVQDEVNSEKDSGQHQIDYANAVIGQGLLDTFA